MELELQEDIWREHIEQLVDLRRSIDEVQYKQGDSKRGARSQGLNMDALNALVPILAKYPHDRGAGVLEELVRYARAYGTDLAVLANTPAVAGDEGTAGCTEPVLAAAVLPPTVPHRIGLAPLRRWMQILMAVSVTVGLLWLLS